VEKAMKGDAMRAFVKRVCKWMLEIPASTWVRVL